MVYSPESYNPTGSWANVELEIREDIAVDTLGFDSSVLLFIPMGVIGIGTMGIVYPIIFSFTPKMVSEESKKESVINDKELRNNF